MGDRLKGKKVAIMSADMAERGAMEAVEAR